MTSRDQLTRDLQSNSDLISIISVLIVMLLVGIRGRRMGHDICLDCLCGGGGRMRTAL